MLCIPNMLLRYFHLAVTPVCVPAGFLIIKAVILQTGIDALRKR